MNLIFRIFKILSILLFVFVPKVYSQWISLDGPAIQSGVWTTSLGTINNRVFIGQNVGTDYDIRFGLFEVLENGRKLKRNESAGTILSEGIAFASDEEIIIFGIKGGIVISNDKGDNWETYNYSIFSDQQVAPLFIKGDTMIVYSAWEMYRSFDKGITWEKLSKKKGQNFNGSAIVQVGQSLFKANDWELLKSDDWGTTWNPVGGGLWSRMDCLLFDGIRLYVTSQAGLFISYDQGLTFSFIDLGIEWLNTITRHGDILLVGTSLNDRIYRSADNGLTWTGLPHRFIKNYVIDLASTDSVVYSGGTDGYLYSLDNGSNWHFVQGTRVASNKIISKDNVIYAATAHGLFNLSENDQVWNPVNYDVQYKGTSDFLVEDSVIYAANDAGVNKSVDLGKNWNLIGLSDYNVKTLSKNMDDMIAGTLSNGVFYTNTNGQLWINRNNGLPKNEFGEYHSITKSFINSSVALVGSAGNGIFRSVDKGLNWIKSNGLENDSITSIIQSGIEFYASSEKGVYKSTDSGINWTKMTDPPLSSNISCLFFNNIHLFAGSLTGGVSIYDKIHDRWVSLNSGLPSTKITALTGNEDSLLISTFSNGIYFRGIKNYLGDENTIATTFKIYPNPCQSALYIELKSPDSKPFKIIIKGMDGKTISKQSVSNLSGKLHLDVSQLTPGAYLISMNPNGKWESFSFVKL